MNIRITRPTVIALAMALAGLGCQQPSQIDKPAVTQTLMEKEGQAWAAIRDRQADTFKGLVTENFVTVSSWGFQDLNQKVADINNPNFTLKEFAFSDMKVIFPAQNNAVVTYKATYKYVVGGQEGGGAVNCSSVWANRDNKWLGLIHTESVPVK